MIYFRFINHLLSKWWWHNKDVGGFVIYLIISVLYGLGIWGFSLIPYSMDIFMVILALFLVGCATALVAVLIIKTGRSLRLQWDEFDKRKVEAKD